MRFVLIIFFLILFILIIILLSLVDVVEFLLKLLEVLRVLVYEIGLMLFFSLCFVFILMDDIICIMNV